MAVRKFLAKIIATFLVKYFEKEEFFFYNNISLKISKGVFKPRYTLSSLLLLKALEKISPKTPFLDIGCGSGILGIFYSSISKSYGVLSDIDWNACKNSKENAIQNNVIVDVVQADVATAFRENVFRLVIANPPYLPLKRREKMLNIAAGEELEILEKFVKTSATCLKRSEVLLITTSTLTPLKGFKGICEKYGFRCEEYFSKRTLVDKIIVFKCVKL